MRLGLGVALALAGLLAGCDEGLPAPAADVAAVAAAQNPFASVERPRPEEVALRGRVQEVARAGSYTYLRVTCDDAVERWVVTMRRGFSVGAQVDIKNMGMRRDFRSNKLGRTFDELIFAVVRPSEGAAR